MNYIEILLSEKLKNKNPMLDIFGSDHKVLQIACQDLTNYLRVHWDLVGKKESECKLVDKLEEYYNENLSELQSFVNLWTGMWLQKWKERVKLLIGKEKAGRWDKAEKTLNKAEPLWKKLLNRQEMKEVVTYKLIRNGEICGTSILAENLLKMELGRNKRRYIDEKEKTLNVVNNALRKAKELARSKGPLIFVKVDKGYYDYS